MTSIRKVATGVAGLDAMLRGGIPEGRASLLAGRSGTGKTVLALQIAAHLARRACPVIVVAVEESPDDLRTTGDVLGLDYTGLQAADRICFADATRLEGTTIVTGEYDLQGLRHRLEALAGQTGARALMLDSATALFSPRPPPDDLRSHVFQLVAGLRSLGLTSIILAESQHDYGDLTSVGIEGFACDVTILLRNVVDGSRRRRSIEIGKYRRSGHLKGEFPCAIGPGGLTVFPIDEVAAAGETPRRAVDGPDARVSTGIAGLDEMTGGGWVRHSVIVVHGPSGSGKTLVAGQFARAGAARGERVQYYALEETRPLLLGNFRQVGIDLEPFIDSGRLRVSCGYADATSLEDLLVDAQIDLEQRKTSLVVVDGMSSIEHSSSRRTYRQFLAGLMSIVRHYRCTALLTQGADASDLSTLADAMLSIDLSNSHEGAIRELRLVKSRGSTHAAHPYRLAIERDGAVVTPATRTTTASIPAPQ
jgi:circadian clock protein KaiC